MKKSHDSFDAFPQEQVRSAIRAGISQAKGQVEMPVVKKRTWRSKLVYGFVSIAAVFAILVGSSQYSPALANSLSQIPIIGSIFGNSNLIGLQRAEENGLTSQIGETQTVDGISVTLQEILYDQNSITIGLYIESERELEPFYFGAGMDLTINGKLPTSGSGSYGEDFLSPKSLTAIQEISITNEMPDKFDLGLILRGKEGEKWYFSTPIEKIADIQTVPVNHVQTVDGVTLTVLDISFSKTGVSIAYESSEAGTDFELSRGGNIDFFVVDQEGNEITGHSGGASGELKEGKMEFISSKKFDPLDSHVTELTITPYLVIPTDGGGVEIDKDGKERVLEYKGNLIQPIEFESFTVKVPQ